METDDVVLVKIKVDVDAMLENTSVLDEVLKVKLELELGLELELELLLMLVDVALESDVELGIDNTLEDVFDEELEVELRAAELDEGVELNADVAEATFDEDTETEPELEIGVTENRGMGIDVGIILDDVSDEILELRLEKVEIEELGELEAEARLVLKVRLDVGDTDEIDDEDESGDVLLDADVIRIEDEMLGLISLNGSIVAESTTGKVVGNVVPVEKIDELGVVGMVVVNGNAGATSELLSDIVSISKVELLRVGILVVAASTDEIERTLSEFKKLGVAATVTEGSVLSTGCVYRVIFLQPMGIPMPIPSAPLSQT